MPPELDVETNPNQNTDWEKEGLKREQQLNNPNLTPEERQMNNYLRNLQQNTLRNAESAYQSRYGSLVEDGSDKKGLSGGVIALIVIGVMIVIGIVLAIILSSTGNKKEKKH
nr:1469_t:CDS:2 [Entrophospora candida]